MGEQCAEMSGVFPVESAVVFTRRQQVSEVGTTGVAPRLGRTSSCEARGERWRSTRVVGLRVTPAQTECSCCETGVLRVDSFFKEEVSLSWKLCEGLNVCVLHVSVCSHSLPLSLPFYLPLLKAQSRPHPNLTEK